MEAVQESETEPFGRRWTPRRKLGWRPLGALVSFSTPEASLDKLSNLHVLFQNGGRSFLYTVVAPDGEPIIRQTWDQTTGRPRLVSETDGRVIVRGGARRILLSDLPPPLVAHTNDTVQSK